MPPQQHVTPTYPQLLPGVKAACPWALPLAALLSHLQEIVKVKANEAWMHSKAQHSIQQGAAHHPRHSTGTMGLVVIQLLQGMM